MADRDLFSMLPTGWDTYNPYQKINWFNTNEIQEDFIIIDDDKSLNDLPKFFKNRLILTSSLIGLNANHWDDIQAIVDKQAVVFN